MFRIEFKVDGNIQYCVSGLKDKPFKKDFYYVATPRKDSVFGWGFRIEDKVFYVNDASKHSVATLRVFKDS